MQALKLSTPQTSNKSAAFSAKDNAFKTSNPQIFPSLNPMGALYKQRKVSRPNPVVQEEEQCELAEPVKKLRCNTGSEKILPPTGYTKAEPSRREENVDKDGFRVPKLPRRLLNKNKAQPATTQETSKPLSEDTIRELKILQTASMIQMHYQNMQNKKHLEALDNGHNIEILDQGFDSSVLLNSLYDRLRLEYYAFQMRQLYQLYQNNDDQGLVWSLSDNQSEKMNREIHC